MKRPIAVSLSVLIATALVLTGCSANANNAANASQSSTTGSAQTGASSDQKSGERKNFKRPNLIGEVQNIVGNSVTLALAKMPTRETTGSQTGQKSQTSSGGNEMPSGPPPGDFQGQGSGASGNKTSGSNSSQSTTQRRSMALTLTGETKEVLIPVGVTITSGFGKNAKTIDIADIKKGSVLMIYYVEGTENIDHIGVR